MIYYRMRNDSILAGWYVAFEDAYDQHLSKLLMRDVFEGGFEKAILPPLPEEILGVVRRTGEGPRLRPVVFESSPSPTPEDLPPSSTSE